MAKFSKGHSFVEDEQITHEKLNNLVDAATFASDAVDNSTTEISSGAIIVKTGGITHSQLATNSVKEVKIVDSSVTTAKIANDAINADKIADNAIDSEHYTDASIDQEHLNNDVITGQDELTAVPATTDTILLSDADDSGNLKKFAPMKYLPLPRAFGLIVMDGSGDIDDVPDSGRYGCSCTGFSSSAYTFDLDSTMSGTNYVVLTQEHGTAKIPEDRPRPGVEIVDNNTFKIHTHLLTAGRDISFVVFGTLA